MYSTNEVFGFCLLRVWDGIRWSGLCHSVNCGSSNYSHLSVLSYRHSSLTVANAAATVVGGQASRRVHVMSYFHFAASICATDTR